MRTLSFSLPREDRDCARDVEQKPASQVEKETTQSGYSDDSFEEEEDDREREKEPDKDGDEVKEDDEEEEEEEKSSEEERTPTFEFNMTPPSIGNSGCEELNEVLPNFKVRHIDDDDTASDVSEIELESLPALREPRGICGGTLQRKQSGWRLFDDKLIETEQEAAKDETFGREDSETIDDEHVQNFEVSKMSNEMKIAADKELDRMDDKIFGLLRSTAQPSWRPTQGAKQVSVVYPGDSDSENMSTERENREKKVRITIEPEVFLVPFSSREFDEPFFDEADFVSSGSPFESRFKHINLDPFSRECGDDPDDSGEECFSGEMAWKQGNEEQSKGFYCMQGANDSNGFGRIDGTQGVSKMNTSDAKKHNVDGECEVQTESLLRNVNLDPCSQEFMDSLDELLGVTEDEDVQTEIGSNTAKEVDEVAVSANNSVCGRGIEAQTVSKGLEKTQLPSESKLIDDNDSTPGKQGGDISDQPQGTSKDTDVDICSLDVQKDEQESSLNSVEEDIQEEIISDDNEHDEEAGNELWIDTKGTAMTKSGAEHLDEKPLRCQMSVSGKLSQNTKALTMELETEATNKTPPKAKAQEHEKKALVLDTITNHKLHTSDGLSVEGLSHYGNEQVSAGGIEANDVAHPDEWCEDEEPGPIILQDKDETQDATPSGNLVPVSERFEHVTEEMKEENKGVEDTFAEGLAGLTTHTNSFPEKEENEMNSDYLTALDALHTEVNTLKEQNGELQLQLEEKNQESYTIECLIKSANVENEKLLDQVENLENELKTALSEKEKAEMGRLRKGRAQKTTALEETSEVVEKLTTEVKALRKQNEQLELHLEESDMQRSKMESIVEQLNIENEKLLENIDGLESALAENKTAEFDLEELRKKAVQENDILRDYLKNKENEIESLKKEEMMDISAQLQQMKELHAKIRDIRKELCGKKTEAVFERCLEETSDSQSRLCLLEELRDVTLSVVKMSDDLKETTPKMLEDSARENSAVETYVLVTKCREDYQKTLEQQNLQIKSLEESNEKLRIQLEKRSADGELNKEIKSLTKQNKQIKLQLEESDEQRRNMDCIIKQLTIEKNELSENNDGLETALSQQNAIELNLEELLKEAKEENETLQTRLRDIKTEKETANEEEIMGIVAELEQLKKLHAKIGDIRMELCGEKEAILETCLKQAESPHSRLSVLQELRTVMLSTLHMGDDLKNTMIMIMEESAQHKKFLDTDLAEIKGEYLRTLDQQNAEISSLKLQNEELQLQLEERSKESHNEECKIESVNAEREKLLKRIDDLEKELQDALDERNEVENELNKKNSKDEYRERELSNLRENMRCKTFNWEEMDAALDQVWNDKQKLEEELQLRTASLEESEAAKLELVKEMNKMKIQLEKLKDEQEGGSNSMDHGYLGEKVDGLKDLLALRKHNEERVKMEVESAMVKASSIINDDAFFQPEHQYKIRIEELEKENTLLLRKLAKTIECSEKSDDASTNLEKQIKTLQEELRDLRDESVYILQRNENKGKKRYKKLKKLLTRNEEGGKSLKKSVTRGIDERMEMDKDLKRQIQKDMEQMGLLLKQVTQDRTFLPYDRTQHTRDEWLDNQIKELRGFLEKTLQKTESDLEMNRSNLNLQIQKNQELENKYQVLSKRLQEIECEFEINKIRLKDKCDKVEELNLKLREEKENSARLRQSYDKAETRKRQEVMDKENEVNKLRDLLAETDRDAQNMKEQLINMTKDLESTKEALDQKDSELAIMKESLCEGDKLLYNFRETLTSMEREVGVTKRGLMEKSAALHQSERDAEMIFKSARKIDREMEVTNKLVIKVMRNLARMEKLIKEKMLVVAAEEWPQETIRGNLLSGDRFNEVNGMSSSQNEMEKVLEERDDTPEQPERSKVQIKQETDLMSTSRKEKDKDLQELISAYQRQGKELENSKAESSKLGDEINSLRKELAQSNALLFQKDDEIKELKELVALRDSQLRTESKEVEQLKLLLQTKQNAIEVLEHDLAKEGHERKSLTEHLYKKMDEIRRLQETLTASRNKGGHKSLEDYRGVNAHMKASKKNMEDFRKVLDHKEGDDERENKIYFQSAFAKLEESNKELAPKALDIEVRKERLDVSIERLRQLELKFEVCKQKASEAESNMKKENDTFEEKFKNLEAHLHPKEEIIEESRSVGDVEGSEWGRSGSDIPGDATDVQEEEKRSWSIGNEEKELSKAEIAKLAGKQIADAMADRMHQMLADMYGMQMELESQRSDYGTLTTKNKDLKERVDKLEIQVVKKDEVHSERLNNVLHHVRMKRKEVHGLKALLRMKESWKSHDEVSISEVTLS